ncbi:MAG: SDR family oxidoreductase [Cyclobacteriaceae bacterium]
MSNHNKYALITGASSGFGFEFAKIFAQHGYNLVLVARAEDKLVEISNDLTQTYLIEVLTISKDLFKPSSAEEIYAELKSKNIVVDVLVNDAGQGEHGNFVEYDLARDVDMIQLNITSLVSLTKLFLKDMVTLNEGKILQVASLLGKYPTPLMAVYAATKAFVISFTEGLIKELKETKVTVTALLPGAADTDFFHKAGAEDSTTYREEELSKPDSVAQDGFDALMRGESRVVSGFKNKLYAGISNLMPDGALAGTMHKKMKPSDAADGRDSISHGPSWEERVRIDETTGGSNGDYKDHEDHIHTKE